VRKIKMIPQIKIYKCSKMMAKCAKYTYLIHKNIVKENA
jgi:hypothetical protein